MAYGHSDQNARRSWDESAAVGTGWEIFHAPIHGTTHFAKFARRDGSIDDCMETNGGAGFDNAIALMLPEIVHQKVTQRSHKSPGNNSPKRGTQDIQSGASAKKSACAKS